MFMVAMTTKNPGAVVVSVNTKRSIKPHKGGRDDRIYARITKEAKAKLLARVKAEGYKSLGDWLEAQAMAKPNKA